MPKRPGPSSTSRVKQDNSSIETLPFGDLLTSARNAKGLTQTNLAESIRRSTSFISLLETGQRRPTRELIDALASTLGLTPDTEMYGALLRAAGYEPKELSGAVSRIVDILAEQIPMSESHKVVVRSDLTGLIDGCVHIPKFSFTLIREISIRSPRAVGTYSRDVTTVPRYSPAYA